MQNEVFGSYNLWLVALSYAIAVFASYTALSLAGQVKPTAKSRPLWLVAGASSMGMGIWSMHFVAIIAFHLPLTVTCNCWLMLLSLLLAIIASGMALVLISRPRSNWLRLLGGGISIGSVLTGMHYLGMAGLRRAWRDCE